MAIHFRNTEFWALFFFYSFLLPFPLRFSVDVYSSLFGWSLCFSSIFHYRLQKWCETMVVLFHFRLTFGWIIPLGTGYCLCLFLLKHLFRLFFRLWISHAFKLFICGKEQNSKHPNIQYPILLSNLLSEYNAVAFIRCSVHLSWRHFKQSNEMVMQCKYLSERCFWSIQRLITYKQMKTLTKNQIKWFRRTLQSSKRKVH